jgi:DNA polymerase delta subunit 2
MAALGMETSAGDFEVIDLCFAGLPDLVDTSPASSSNSNSNGKGNGATNDTGHAYGKGKARAANDADGEVTEEEKTWVAVVSGLSVGSEEAPADVKTEMLVEWLTGESGGASVRLPGRLHAIC